MVTDPAVGSALAEAWHRESAESSLERWLQLCERSGWGDVPRDLPMLVRVFGASWYFTRFVFYRGREVETLFDRSAPDPADGNSLTRVLRAALADGTDEEQLEALRIRKNDLMLGLLIDYLSERHGQEQCEAHITVLAESVLAVVMELFGLDPAQAGCRTAILGMGRLAGREMTFGSDLDLIFLYEGPAATESPEFARKIRFLLRHIAAVTPAGTLYDVDMRLRPHGTAGALITSSRSFIEYHGGTRETWERQVMTRCRPVYDPSGLGAETLERVLANVYEERDCGALAQDIRDMRVRVERELGRPRGKFELKRGRGGIMDVDFTAHYLQLCHGNRIPELKVCSTREALRASMAAGILGEEAGGNLLEGYEYLKRLETCLRLFDLKSTSAFSEQSASALALARAMSDGAGDAEVLVGNYLRAADQIRAQFNRIFGAE